MCVIIVKDKTSDLPQAVIEKAWERNDHGAGFVARKNSKDDWHFKKGIMSLKDLLTEIEPYTNLGSELVLHLRIKSRGAVSPEMTHPFDFSTQAENRWVFHNGTVKLFNEPDNVSDSAFLASLLKDVSTTHAHKILDHISGTHGRFVTVTEKDICIFPDHESVWKEYMGSKGKLWFSNTRHENFKKVMGVEVMGDGGYDDYDGYEGWFERRNESKFKDKWKNASHGAYVPVHHHNYTHTERHDAERQLAMKLFGDAKNISQSVLSETISHCEIDRLKDSDLHDLCKSNLSSDNLKIQILLRSSNP